MKSSGDKFGTHQYLWKVTWSQQPHQMELTVPLIHTWSMNKVRALLGSCWPKLSPLLASLQTRKRKSFAQAKLLAKISLALATSLISPSSWIYEKEEENYNKSKCFPFLSIWPEISYQRSTKSLLEPTQVSNLWQAWTLLCKHGQTQNNVWPYEKTPSLEEGNKKIQPQRVNINTLLIKEGIASI